MNIPYAEFQTSDHGSFEVNKKNEHGHLWYKKETSSNNLIFIGVLNLLLR